MEIIEAHGQIIAPDQVRAGERILYARHILIATGGRPFVPELPGRELALVSDDLFVLPALPRTVAVVGGGYIATEFASILHGLGVTVHQLYRGELFLRGFDDDIRQFVCRQMRAQGMSLLFNTDVRRIEALGEGRRLHLDNGDALDVDAVFYATGRVPNIEGLFGKGVSVRQRDNGAIEVDGDYRTSVPGLYALGDVTDRVQLTPVALAEGMWLARTLFAEDKPAARPDYENIATAVFCHPNIGTIGLTEQQAGERYGTLRVYRSDFRPLRYTLGESGARTLMKLIVDDASDRVVGLHMAGDEAGEIVQGFAVAITMGATKADFDRTLGIHPTAAEEFVTMR